MNPMTPASRWRRTFSVVIATTWISACASAPPLPTAEMTRAESAIEQARIAGAPELASATYEEARQRLVDARAAVAKRDNARAAMLVEEAQASARLADITAQRIKSAAAAAEVDKSIQTLQTETRRTTTP